MANSGIYWVDITFDWCVKFLYIVADLFGITYEEINIWLFVIIGPLFFLISICLNYYFYKKTKKLKKIIELQNKEITESNEVEVQEKKQDYLKILIIILLIIFIFYFLEVKTSSCNYLNKLIIIVKIKLIIMQVTIGKKNVEFPDLNIISPGNCPNPSFFM